MSLLPVFFQSSRKASSPLLVSVCFTSALSTAGGTVQTSAPSLAASITCIGWRMLATSTSVLKRSEEHTSELQSLMRISYAVFCLKKKNHHSKQITDHTTLITLQMLHTSAT